MPKQSRVVFVGCLSARVDEGALRAKFEAVGEVEHVEIARTADGKSKQFAYVTFASPEMAEEAILRFHDTLFHDKVLNVERYERKRRGGAKEGEGEHHRRSSFAEEERRHSHRHHRHSHRHHSRK